MSSLYLFTGPNTFAIRVEKHKWRDQFVEKHGPENYLSLDGKGLSYRTLLDEVSTAPFIAPKRLVVIDGVPKFSKEEMEALDPAIHPDCIVVFSDSAPDKRLGGVKVLQKVATTKLFPLLMGRALTDWMAQTVQLNGSSIASDAMTELLRIVGEDQDMLAPELQKLETYASGRSITKADVQKLAVPSGEQEIWTLTNLLAQGKQNEALLFAESLLSRGEDPYGLWSILLWMLRSLVCVTSAVKEGERNPATIASSFSLPFPTVKNLQGIAAKVQLPALQETVRWATQADIDLKTGGYRITSDAPQELIALIESFIVRCARVAG